METNNKRGRIVLGAVGLGGLLAGVVLAATVTAGAEETASGTSKAPSGAAANADPSQPQRSDEKLLTGTTADKVKAAALAKYPGATIVRIETDSDGVYEAHMTKADGTPVTVEIDTSFKVTGEEQGGPGGPGGHDHDGDGPDESGTEG